MNKTTATILGGAIIIGGAIFFSSGVQSATIKKIDNETFSISVLTETEVKIKDLKAKLEIAQIDKNNIKNQCDNNILEIQSQIDEIKGLIQQAKNIGVE